MKLTLEITFECAGELEASSLLTTLAPDNRTLPKDQRLTVEQEGSSLRFSIESARAAAGVSSALSLLSDAKLFHDLWALAV